MVFEQVPFILSCIKAEISNNIDLFLINTSVFFFAHTYIQSQKRWESTLKKITADPSKWETLVSYKEDSQTPVTDKTMDLHPEWTICFPMSQTKEISVSEYKDYIAYDNYEESYEIKYANEKKDRYAALYGAILLILGSYISLRKNCGNSLVAFFVLLIYIAMGTVALKLFSYGVEPMTTVKTRPSRPSFLDE